ncbi:MAG: Sjogren's syndrome/scleroderma autoantigen 1 family protein [Candidatus Odinarchaeia archaeon]
MSDEKITKMAEYLRKGATMLSYNCPMCNSPLFRYKGEIYCIHCNKKVKIVKEGEEAKEQVTQQTDAGLLNLETTVLGKIQQLNLELQNENDYYKIEQLANLIRIWLEILEKIKKLRSG